VAGVTLEVLRALVDDLVLDERSDHCWNRVNQVSGDNDEDRKWIKISQKLTVYGCFLQKAFQLFFTIWLRGHRPPIHLSSVNIPF
jgi:hypothetical protein